MDRIGADSGSDCDAYHPFLGMLLRDIDLEPLDAAMDVRHGNFRPRWHRNLSRDDYLRRDDDCREHRLYGSVYAAAMVLPTEKRCISRCDYLEGLLDFSLENLALKTDGSNGSRVPFFS